MEKISDAETDLINERRRIRGYLRQILTLHLGETWVQEQGIEKSCLVVLKKLATAEIKKQKAAAKKAAKKATPCSPSK